MVRKIRGPALWGLSLAQYPHCEDRHEYDKTHHIAVLGGIEIPKVNVISSVVAERRFVDMTEIFTKTNAL